MPRVFPTPFISFTKLMLLVFFLLLTSPAIARQIVTHSEAYATPVTRAKVKKKKRKHIRKRRISVKRNKVAGGPHWRISNRKRTLHVWQPPGYNRKRAGIVVFIHGYHINADRTWKAQHMASQFKASRQNALFIVVDGPTSVNDQVKFPALGEVLRIVRRYTRLHLPRGHIVVMGHSAAFLTIIKWLDYRLIDHVILLDALYSREDHFYDWLTHKKYGKWRRLVLVGRDTKRQSRRFLKRFNYALQKKRIPKKFSEFTRRERRAQVLYMPSQYKHSALVYNHKVIPLLLRLTRLGLIKK